MFNSILIQQAADILSDLRAYYRLEDMINSNRSMRHQMERVRLEQGRLSERLHNIYDKMSLAELDEMEQAYQEHCVVMWPELTNGS